MAHIRTLLLAAVALGLALLVALYPTQLFQLLASAVIVLSTASTLVFFGFVIRTAFRSVNERSRQQRVPVNQMTAHRSVRDEPNPPMTPIKQS